MFMWVFVASQPWLPSWKSVKITRPLSFSRKKTIKNRCPLKLLRFAIAAFSPPYLVANNADDSFCKDTLIETFEAAQQNVHYRFFAFNRYLLYHFKIPATTLEKFRFNAFYLAFSSIDNLTYIQEVPPDLTNFAILRNVQMTTDIRRWRLLWHYNRSHEL